MLFNSSVKRDVEHLRDDAARVFDDVARLRDRIADLGKSRSADLSDDIRARVHDNIDTVSTRVAGFGNRASDYVQDIGSRMTSGVRARPFAIMLGVVAVGLCAGALVPFLRRR